MPAKIYKKDLLVDCTVRELIAKLQNAPLDAEVYIIGLNTGEVEFGWEYGNLEVQLL